MLVLRGFFVEAVALAEKAAIAQRDSRGMLHRTDYLFYKSFALMAGEGVVPIKAGMSLQMVLRSFRDWAGVCPANFRSRERLLNAEFKRRRRADAIPAYVEAAQVAAESGHPHLEALAERRIANLLDTLGRSEEASLHWSSATALFRKWGASGLVPSVAAAVN